MKSTTKGVLSKLTTILLSAIVCVACNSEPEPEVEVAVLEEVELSEEDTVDECTLDIPGVKIDISSVDVSNGLLNEFGGSCQLSKEVLASAADLRRSFVKNYYCISTYDTESAAEVEDRELTVIRPDQSTDVEPDSEAESEKLNLAQSLCDDASVMDWAVEEFLKTVQLEVYSIGTVVIDSVVCPAVVWRQTDDEEGQLYNVTSIGKCVEAVLPTGKLYNPEHNPDGQLTGDYLRKNLGYSGDLPDQFDYKGKSYPFVSDEDWVPNEQAQVSRLNADRTILGSDADKYIYWSTGDDVVEFEYLAADETLPVHYHAVDLDGTSPDERALSALQRSYGAPAIAAVKLIEDEIPSSIHATVETSSGDSFVMIVEPGDSMSESELVDWLSGTHAELLVVQELDAESNEYLSLEGALFTDGLKTVYGQLLACGCDTQGVLGWLGQDQVDLSKAMEKTRRDYIARERETTASRDWVVSDEIDSRPMGYSLSRYRKSAQNNDAAFVVHDGKTAHTLFVAMDLTCNDQSLLFKLGGETLQLPADCRQIGTSGVAYTLREESRELMRAIRVKPRMTIGLVEPGATTPQEEFAFSLLGSANAMNQITADEAGYGESIVGHFEDLSPGSEAENSVFAMLTKRPVHCRGELNPPECIERKSAPVIAAAKPAVQVARRNVEPADFTPGYARTLARQLGSGNQPACVAVVESILEVARSSGSPENRATQIDLIVGRAPNICF
ncbi:MAG: hypothetical protein AB8B87_20420 [Granulosicoccus sp.]